MLVLSLVATGASLGCGSGSSQVTLPPVSAAGVNHISGFTPSGPVPAGKPVKLSFTIVQPNGQPLTQYATGPGPHTGVHLIFVRKDLADIVHLHPPIGPDGTISETVTFPAPGPWMLLTDVYEKQSGTSFPLNYQLKQDLQVNGRYVPKPLGPVRTSVTTDGYTFTIHHMPKLKVANADYLNVSVTDRRRQAGHLHALVRGAGARRSSSARETWPTSTPTSAARICRCAPQAAPSPGHPRSPGSSRSGWCSRRPASGACSCKARSVTKSSPPRSRWTCNHELHAIAATDPDVGSGGSCSWCRWAAGSPTRWPPARWPRSCRRREQARAPRWSPPISLGAALAATATGLWLVAAGLRERSRLELDGWAASSRPSAPGACWPARRRSRPSPSSSSPPSRA